MSRARTFAGSFALHHFALLPKRLMDFLPRYRSWLLAALMVAFARTGATAPPRDAPAPLDPETAAKTMRVPPGFSVTLFAGEPDVQQPIGFCIDDRGRLWVAEAYNYPVHGERPGDRVIILEDVDGDGRFDRRSVFCEGLNYVTGIEVGFGGAWVVSPPYFYFIPDRDGDDRPDGDPVVLLDGLGNHANSHNLANALAWGPDGWLYGTHGRTNWSKIGKPGTPKSQRIVFDGGVYRYHPVRHEFEPFADGTTNPWGIDWDDFGQGFVCNCVDPHLYHVIQGAHYEPWRNRESSRFAYQRIATIADHLHFTGKGSLLDGIGSAEEDAAGGGHAHCGTMIYLGDSWPEKYRNTAFMHNLHGKRINNDILRRAGSGYVASHGPDLMRAEDPWFMGVTLQYGPDGSVYSSDWSDTGECHSVVNTRRGTGRIYKIRYGELKGEEVDLRQHSDRELVELHAHRNDWFVRHARRLLQERAAAGAELSVAVASLRAGLTETRAVERRLRYLWTLHALGTADDALLAGLLSDDSEYLRAWAIRLLAEDRRLTESQLQEFQALGERDPSAFVCLHLASAMQRLAPTDRWPIAESLALRGEFGADQNLPLMLWYAVEPLVHETLPRFVKLAATSRIPLLRRHIARRIAAMPNNPQGMELLVTALGRTATEQETLELIEGMLTGLEGTRSLAMPKAWPAQFTQLRESSSAELRDLALRLALVFDDPAAVHSLAARAADRRVPAEQRERAIASLVARRTDGFDAQLLKLALDQATRRAALRGLAEYEHPATVDTILELYPKLDVAAREDALQTLAAKAVWARALIEAIEAEKIPRGDVTAFTARQIASLGDKELSKKVQSLWGQLRETPRERQRLIAEYKSRLTPETLQAGDRAHGRALFDKTCAACHKLFDAGKNIGPELTGAQRTNVEYLLFNLLDPSAAISRDYQLHVVETSYGRIVTGLLAGESDNAITIQTATDRVVIPKDEVESRSIAGASMMPEGLLTRLTVEEVRDLFAYLSGALQVEPSVEPESSAAGSK